MIREPKSAGRMTGIAMWRGVNSKERTREATVLSRCGDAIMIDMKKMERPRRDQGLLSLPYFLEESFIDFFDLVGDLFIKHHICEHLGANHFSPVFGGH